MFFAYGRDAVTLSIARFIFAAETNSMARVIWRVDFTERTRRRSCKSEGIP